MASNTQSCVTLKYKSTMLGSGKRGKENLVSLLEIFRAMGETGHQRLTEECNPMLNRSILREERSVLLEVLEKHPRVDVLGFKKELPKTAWNVGIMSVGGWGR